LLDLISDYLIDKDLIQIKEWHVPVCVY